MENIFVLSPHYTAWKLFKTYPVALDDLESFENNTPTWMLERRQSIGIFIPGIIQLPQQLFNILSVALLPRPLKEFGAATYHERKSLWLSIPDNVFAKEYLYYTALHEVLDMQNSDSSMYEAEKQVIALAKNNVKDIRQFLCAHLFFFKWSLAVQMDEHDPHALQIKKVIELLEQEIINDSNQKQSKMS